MMDWFEFESKCLDCGVCWTSGVDGKLFIFSRSYCSQYVESIDWLNVYQQQQQNGSIMAIRSHHIFLEANGAGH